jgi:hypothetical protein
MIGQPSILRETVRRGLEHDCEQAGYTPADAGRLADAILSGRTMPGLVNTQRAARPVVKAASDTGRPVVEGGVR